MNKAHKPVEWWSFDDATPPDNCLLLFRDVHKYEASDRIDIRYVFGSYSKKSGIFFQTKPATLVLNHIGISCMNELQKSDITDWAIASDIMEDSLLTIVYQHSTN